MLPAPGALCTVTLPPCTAVSSATSARPMPAPSCERPPAFGTRRNRSNRRTCSAVSMPMPVSVTDSSAQRVGHSSTAATRTVMVPCSVNLRAFDSRLMIILSHWSRSIHTGSGNGGHSTTKARPAFSVAARNIRVRSAVWPARSTGSYWGSSRPASIRTKSSRLLTRRSSRSALRRTSSTRSRWTSASGNLSSVRASCAGPSISVSGVRNS